MVRLEKGREGVCDLFSVVVKVDEFLYAEIVGFCDDFIASAYEEGEEDNGAGFVLVLAAIMVLEAEVGTGSFALRVYADLLCFLVVHAGHVFH